MNPPCNGPLKHTHERTEVGLKVNGLTIAKRNLLCIWI